MPPNENDLYIFYKPLKEWPQGDGTPHDDFVPFAAAAG